MVVPTPLPREVEGGVVSCDARGPREMTSVPFPLPVGCISQGLRAFGTSTGKLEGLLQPVWEWGRLGVSLALSAHPSRGSVPGLEVPCGG